MDERVQKVKSKLLELGYQDNKYLADYLELIEKNLNTTRDSSKTQAHHVIPTKEFSSGNHHYKVKGKEYSWHKTINTAELDEANFRVHLLYSDHLCAHNLLSLCRDLAEIQRNFEDYQHEKKFKTSLTNTALNVRMPRYITEDEILEKLKYYTDLYEQAPDERTAHKYRTYVAQWKSRYKQFLENPEKYSDSQYHDTAQKKRELKQIISEAHKYYTFLCNSFDRSTYKTTSAANTAMKNDTDIQKARTAWKTAIADYNNFVETSRNIKNLPN